MKNENQWTPTKFVVEDGQLRASREPNRVSIASRLNVDLLATALDRQLTAHCRGDLLDVGAGTAPLYARYRPLVQSVTCVDWEHSPHEWSFNDFNADLNESIPIEDSRFDVALMTDVLEHIHSPARLLSEVHRVLRPSGRLIGSVPFLYRLHEQPHDHFRYTEFGLRRLLSGAGFVVESLNAYGEGWDVAVDLLGRLIADSRTPLRFRLIGAMQRIRLKQAQLRTAPEWPDLPLGYIFVALKES